VILADTSAWIDYLRHTRTSADRAMESLRAHEVSITEPVLMELLAGAPSESAAARLHADLVRVERLGVAPADYEVAAGIHRTLRRAGRTMRNQLDCLIAAVAIRNRVPVLHNDAAFDFIAHHTALEIHEPG
jgi:predicted nucleic acid-binding protein